MMVVVNHSVTITLSTITSTELPVIVKLNVKQLSCLCVMKCDWTYKTFLTKAIKAC